MSYFGPDATPLFALPLAEVWFVATLAFLATFLFLDGFDFGIGILYAGRSDAERETLLAVIGPFWDGNEVWLVVFGGALFAAFPPVYAALFSRNYLLLFGVLFALGLRGIAPEFREQRDDDRWRRIWDASFVLGSAGAPFLLGAFAANWVLGRSGFGIPSFAVGLTVVLLCVTEGAVFLAMKADETLGADARRLAVRGALAYLVWVVITLAYLYAFVPATRATLSSIGAVAAVVLALILVAVTVFAARHGSDHVALAAAGGQSYVLVILIGLLLYPVVDPASGLTVSEAFVPPLVANLMTVAGIVLIPVIVFNLAVLYRVFAGPIRGGETY